MFKVCSCQLNMSVFFFCIMSEMGTEKKKKKV